MDLCIWIVDANSCLYSSYLLILIHIGLFVSMILLILYTCTFIYKTRKTGIKSNIKNGINIKFNELLFVSGILIFIFRILYLLFLLLEFNKILVMLFENMSYAILSIKENLIISILIKILKQKNDIFIIPFKINILWIFITFFMTTITSILSGFFFQIQNIKIGYIILGIHFIIYGIQLIIFAIISYYYDKNFNTLIDQINYVEIDNKIDKNRKDIVYRLNVINMISVISGAIYGIIWLSQGIWMIIDYYSYDNILGWVIFVSSFWYFGGFLSCFTLYLIFLIKY